MRILAWADALTTPTSDLGQKCFKALSGGLIAHAASQTWSATLLGIFSAQLIPSERSPRTRLINAITLASTVAVVDHYFPYHRLLSCFAGFAFTILIGQEVSEEIPLRAGVSIGLTYVPTLIEKLFRYTLDRIDIPSIANKTTDGVVGMLNQVFTFTNLTNLALGITISGEVIGFGAIGGLMGLFSIAPSIGFVQLHLILGCSKEIAIASLVAVVSFVATYHLYGPHDIYAHYNVLAKVAATAAIIVSALFVAGHRLREQEQLQRDLPARPQRN